MKLDRYKLDIACARACMTRAEVSQKAGIPFNTLKTCLSRGGSAVNVGKIARALGVDVLDILADDELTAGKGGT